MGFLAFLFSVFFAFAETNAVPIDTPDTDERNDFVVRSPDGWGYRTFKGNNGLIGAFWPRGTSFNRTDTAIFVFLQDSDEELPRIPDNINLFTEKCTKARFKFATSLSDNNPTKSLGEKYFNGRCGRTMILMKEEVENYRIVIALVSAKPYITKKQLSDLKEISSAYRYEAEEYIKVKNGEFDEDEDDKQNSNESDESEDDNEGRNGENEGDEE